MKPAAFGRLWVETLVATLEEAAAYQPPPGGCELNFCTYSASHRGRPSRLRAAVS